MDDRKKSIRDSSVKKHLADYFILSAEHAASQARDVVADATDRSADAAYQLGEEMDALGREADAEEHADRWLKEILATGSPVDQARQIHALLNVAMDTVRETERALRCGRDPTFYAQCGVYAGIYSGALKRLCDEHGLVHVIGGIYECRKT